MMKADSELSKEEYLDAKSEVEGEVKATEQQIGELTESTVDIEGQVEIIINTMIDLREHWHKLSIPEKAKILQIMTKSVVLGKHGDNKKERQAIRIEWERHWDMFTQFNINSIEDYWYALTDSNCRPTDSYSVALYALKTYCVLKSGFISFLLA